MISTSPLDVSNRCLCVFFVAMAAAASLVHGAATFTFVNRCPATVFPGILSNAGSPRLETTGFELPSGAASALTAPSGWSGRFWARTGCALDAAGHLSCATGDCRSGAVECLGAGATPPATLAEFTLAAAGGKDFYDVSLVDGYNVPVLIEAVPSRAGVSTAGSSCAPAGCLADINARCPAELRVGSGDTAACRSACDAFGKAEYCCSGAYANPNTCQPTAYSAVFKSACPRSYSYAFDDPTSTFTCAGGADYTVTFCPAATASQKAMTSPQTTNPGGDGSDPQPTATPSSAAGQGGVVLENSNSNWLASLAYGDSSGSGPGSATTPVLAGVALAAVAFLLVAPPLPL